MSEKKEIDILSAFMLLWRKRVFIVCTTLLFLIVGVLIVFFRPNEYVAECGLAMEIEDNTMHININDVPVFQGLNQRDYKASRILNPEEYQGVINSTPFKKKLIYAKVLFDENGDVFSFYEYFVKNKNDNDRGNDTITALVNNVEQLSHLERACIRYLKDRIKLEISYAKNYVKLSVRMPQPYMAAGIAQQLQELLQQYIIDFKTAKIQATYDFLQGRYYEIKSELEQKQQSLIYFYANNKTESSSVQFKTEEKMLLNDYELFFELYSDVVKQLEKMKIQQKENIQALTVIEPVLLPQKPVGKKAPILILALFGGMCVGCVCVLLESFMKICRRSIKDRQL